MRQIGSLPHESEANRLAAYLVTQGIKAHAEQNGDQWVVWVRDEDQLDSAKEHYAQFRVDPQATAYQGAEDQAETIEREEQQRLERAQKNIVQMRGKWGGRTLTRQHALVVTLIVLSALVSVGSGFARSREGTGLTIHRQLRFRDPISDESRADALHDIKQGQLWRLVTSIFLHGDFIHLFFNMFWLYYFGVQIESRWGTWRLGLIVLVVAVFSNFVEALLPSEWNATPDGIGMSGVVFGLFGFVWISMLLRPTEGLSVSQVVIVFFVAYAVLGVSGMLDQFMEHVDHWAHGLGLVAGMGLAYLPDLTSAAKSPRR